MLCKLNKNQITLYVLPDMGCSPSIPQNVNLVNKDWIIANAAIGDMIILSGKGNISNCVREFSDSCWSHVGMIYVDHSGHKFVWESSQDLHLYDHNTKKFKDGPRLVDLGEMLKNYEVSLFLLLLDSDILFKRVILWG